MKVTRRLKITVTRYRELRTAAVPVQAFCPACGHVVETLADAEAAKVLRIDAPALAGLIAAGRVHVIALVNGGWRVCQASLFV